MSDEAGAGVGHNSSAIEAALRDSAVSIVGFARRCNKLDDEMGELRNDKSSIMGEAKSAGLKANHVKMAQLMLRAEKESVLIDDAKMRIALMQVLNIGFQQMDLFETDARPLDDAAEDRGYADGLAGKSLDNPYQSGEPMQRYAKGWHRAQEEARAALERTLTENKRRREEEEAKKAADKAAAKTGGGETPSDEMLAAVQGVASSLAADASADVAAEDAKKAALAAAGDATKPKSNAEKARDQVKAADAVKGKKDKGEQPPVVH